jgi:hypothetical protein
MLAMLAGNKCRLNASDCMPAMFTCLQAISASFDTYMLADKGASSMLALAMLTCLQTINASFPPILACLQATSTSSIVMLTAGKKRKLHCNACRQ